ncbi:MAG: 4-hydroxythreonine-4-phosphate dehydrogenase PdxA [Calditrichaeota bacterium]|nr:MAG: 4-hydroxythreonine-4-phosphate dehydrogenase PdxA [Calditrichota bacterium]
MPTKIAVTIGDINGIGPEVILKSLLHFQDVEDAEFILFGPKDAYTYWIQKLRFLDSSDFFANDENSIRIAEPDNLPSVSFSIGNPTSTSGAIAAKSLTKAVEMALAGEVDAIVTAPISKYALQQAGYPHPGHTEFLSELSGGNTPVMLMVTGDVRIAVATTHVPLKDVPELITYELLTDRVLVLHHELVDRFGIEAPRIALTALNPHAGENGKIGREEIETISDVVIELQKQGLHVSGPYPADAIFARLNMNKLQDAYLAMYHDQGLIPFKMLSRGKGINYTCGLPFIRTSPDHGTAFDIAGQNKADESSMMEAIQIAISHGSYSKRS